MTPIERYPVPLYFAAVLAGSASGLLLPDSASALEGFVWPVVGVLLYFTFLQVPLFRQAQLVVVLPLALSLPPNGNWPSR